MCHQYWTTNCCKKGRLGFTAWNPKNPSLVTSLYKTLNFDFFKNICFLKLSKKSYEFKNILVIIFEPQEHSQCTKTVKTNVRAIQIWDLDGSECKSSSHTPLTRPRKNVNKLAMSMCLSSFTKSYPIINYGSLLIRIMLDRTFSGNALLISR